MLGIRRQFLTLNVNLITQDQYAMFAITVVIAKKCFTGVEKWSEFV